MKKTVILCTAFIACTMLTTSCSKSSETQSQTTEKKAKKAKKADKDVFFYTAQHRKDKFVPTSPVIGFTDKILDIKAEEFKGNENIREIIVPKHIEHIAESAFEGCTNLETIHFAGEMKVINDNAFAGCTSLKKLMVDTWTVGLSSFEGCTSLEEVRFGDHMWWIRANAFAGCTSLKSILMGITLEKLEDDAFAGCKAVEEFSVPQAMKNRMFGYFADCPNVKKVYILSTEFFPVPKNCTPKASTTIYVPDAFLAQFQGDAGWSKFGEILPLSQSKYFADNGFWKK